jgi:hypothetical protein
MRPAADGEFCGQVLGVGRPCGNAPAGRKFIKNYKSKKIREKKIKEEKK